MKKTTVSETDDKPTLDAERSLAAGGFDLIIGFDEVGRGALAGPVMVGAAAVWARDLGNMDVPPGVADSKTLTERRREALFEPLQQWCAASAVGQASNTEIDDWGITHALGIAALRALNDIENSLGIKSGDFGNNGSTGNSRAIGSNVDKNDVDRGVGHNRNIRGGNLRRDDKIGNTVSDGGIGDIVSNGSSKETYGEANGDTAEDEKPQRLVAPRIGAILDGPSDYITAALNTFDAPAVPVPAYVTTVVKGDRHCAMVAAASIIAKVTRDRLMVGIARGNDRYTPYDWVHNKGYGSAKHRQAIAQYGPTSLHRISWHLTE